MRRCLRPPSCLLAVVALVSLSLMAASASGVDLPRLTVGPTRAVASQDHAVFLGVIDSRPPGALADLIGLLAVVSAILALWSLGTALPVHLSVAAGDARRRWRARLVGAPPRLA